MIHRPEFELVIRSPHELSGAREGARELEKEIGMAKTIGREHTHLERQLLRTKAAIHWFSSIHPGHGKTSSAELEGMEMQSGDAHYSPQNDHREISLPGGVRDSFDPKAGIESGSDAALVETPASPSASIDSQIAALTSLPLAQSPASSPSTAGIDESTAPPADFSPARDPLSAPIPPVPTAEEQADWSSVGEAREMQAIGRPNPSVTEGRNYQAMGEALEEARMAEWRSSIESRMRNLEQQMKTNR